MNKQGLICERLKKFGYASERRIRLYGEEQHFVSNPIADGAGYSVLAIASQIREPETHADSSDRGEHVGT